MGVRIKSEHPFLLDGLRMPPIRIFSATKNVETGIFVSRLKSVQIVV